jgi:ABC-2 type transport system ATP-binding protein
MIMDAIVLQNLRKNFYGKPALRDLSFSVRQGEIFGLVGPDGAGKTTAMRILSGILDPTAGDAWLDGLHVCKQTRELQEQIGYMSQRFGLYPDLTVWENIQFYADLYGVPKKDRPQRTDRLLKFSDLSPFKSRRAGNLSGGMKQKLGLACALIHTPKILLLDEPTNGVDPVSRRDFWRLLHQLLVDHVTILLSTSYLDEAERCNRVAIINHGALLAIGTPSEIKKQMPHVILEIICPDPQIASALLVRNMPNLSVGLFGDRLHVAVKDDSPTASHDIQTLLVKNNLAVDSIQTVEPSLEDYFVHAIVSQKPS